MIKYIAKKVIINLAVSIGLCLLISRFSTGGASYGGFLAAFLGAVYMLVGWFNLMKLMGTDFSNLLRRKQAPQVPYFHQKDKSQKSGMGMFFGMRHNSDSLDDEARERESELPPQLRLKWRGTSLMLCGAILLILSLFI